MTRLEEALNAYREIFKKDYPLVISGTKTTDEIIANIKHCIETNKPAEDPKYDPNLDY
jgi:FAD/FMN-containing dehydrogenase